VSSLATASPISARAPRLFTIGQVLSILNTSFPELSPSKLRFLEEQGLVTPQRTQKGYRKFTEQNIDRIRIILELQRDKYLPLKVIRQYLADLDEGRQPSLPGSQEIESQRKLVSKRKLGILDLVAETAITEKMISEAQELKLLPSAPFDSAAVEIARALVHLSRFGITPRHLRGLKASAEREIGIIEGVVAPVLAKNDPASKSRAAHYAMEIENQFATIRAELIRSVITKIDG
jgi:DNA-binding transcriptional MerR regulator